MLLDDYDANGLLCQTTVQGQTGKAGVFAYRGDLVIVEGQLREGSTKDRKPPEMFLMHSMMLVENDKIQFLSGLLVDIAHLPLLLQKYKADLAADCLIMLYVANIPKSLATEVEGFKMVLLAYSEGMVWNELMDELYLEKQDFKGQSPEEKVLTMFDTARKHTFKYGEVSFAEAQANTIEAKLPDWGPV
ncbi:MAG: hypothetical protein ACU837_10000 [Gammaproteobacteria bacterium]